jgi:hypothetical protein
MVSAQNKPLDPNLKLRELSASYRSGGGVSFDVQHKYALDESPGMILDSMTGHCIVSGTNYSFVIDDITTVKAGEVMITLFQPDRLMFLTKSTFHQSMNLNPAGILDSLMTLPSDTKSSHIETSKELIIKLDRENDPNLRSQSYHIDKTTGYLVKIVSVIRAGLLSPQADPALKKPDSWVILETEYKNYRKGGIDQSIFDPAKYYTKKGDVYTTTPSYSSYKIFNGTTTLN